MRNEASGACQSEYYHKLTIGSARVQHLVCIVRPPDGGSSTDARRGEFGQLLGPLFFDTVESKSSESPVAGKIEKGVSRFVDLGFRGPLDACAGKLPIFAGCDHGGTSSAEISPTLKTTLPRSAPTVPKGTQVSGL
jgi:hypothetical protein